MDGQKGCKTLVKYLPHSLLMTESEKRYGGSLFFKRKHSQQLEMSAERERQQHQQPRSSPLKMFLSLIIFFYFFIFCFHGIAKVRENIMEAGISSGFVLSF